MKTKATQPRPSKKVQPKPTGDILTLAEAAVFLRVAVKGLEADVEGGKVPGRLVAGEWRFSRRALLDWLGEVETTRTPRKLTNQELVDHIERTGVPWNAESAREAEEFIKAAKALSAVE